MVIPKQGQRQQKSINVTLSSLLYLQAVELQGCADTRSQKMMAQPGTLPCFTYTGALTSDLLTTLDLFPAILISQNINIKSIFYNDLYYLIVLSFLLIEHFYFYSLIILFYLL
jgi:hypothetical protein